MTTVLFASAESRAQFFDDFDGDDLAPHWSLQTSFPTAWDYTVADGLLTVTSLNFPSFAGSATNYQRMYAPFAPIAGDFDVRVTMGWAPGALREMRIVLWGGNGEFGYTELLGQPRLVYSNSLGVLEFADAPGPGVHEFSLIRQGAQIQFGLNGATVATLPAAVGQPLAQIQIGFDVAYPGGIPMSPLMVDRVSVVPTPASSTVVLTALSLALLRRRR